MAKQSYFYANIEWTNPVTDVKETEYASSPVSQQQATYMANKKIVSKLAELQPIATDPLKKLAYLVERIDWYACMSDDWGVAMAGEHYESRVRRYMADLVFADGADQQAILDTWNANAHPDFKIADIAELVKKCRDSKVY